MKCLHYLPVLYIDRLGIPIYYTTWSNAPVIMKLITERMVDMPKIGMRIIKTAVAVFLCFIINLFIGGGYMPFYSAITAVICLQTYAEESIEISKKRILGTFLGALIGLAVLFLEQKFIPHDHVIMQYLLISAAIIPVIYISVLLRQSSASAIACVVFISITAGQSTQVSPLWFALIRMIETLVGIIVALAVNLLHPPKKKHAEDTLFVTGLTGILLNSTGTLSPRSQVELNRMITEGASITVATEMTPAAFLSCVGGVHWRLPIVAMDGAVIYDIEDKRYLDCCSLPHEYAQALQETFQKADVHYFANVLIQDVLLIYYGDFQNDAQKEIYQTLRHSPHRNYIHRSVPEDGQVLYYLIVEKEKRIQEIKSQLAKLSFYNELFILDKNEGVMDGYRYLKIYHHGATKGQMVDRLRAYLSKDKVVAFGSNDNDVDMLENAQISFAVGRAVEEAKAAAKFELPNPDEDAVVQIIRRLFQPFPWERPLKTRKYLSKNRRRDMK